MPKFSDETIKKFPWMWKMDSRRKSRCAVIGHRFRWFKQKGKKGAADSFIGLCRKCAVSYTYLLSTDRQGKNITIRKQMHKLQLSEAKENKASGEEGTQPGC